MLFIGFGEGLFASEIGVAIYINNDNDPDYHWAHGASVIGDSDLRAFRFAGPWFDPDWSDFTLDPPRKATKTFYIHLSITYIKVTPGTGSEGST